MSLAMIVHGGAWAVPDDQVDAHAEGCLEALRRGDDVLQKGGPALDAVIAAIRVMEDDPIFDAGRGSCLTLDGKVEMDASLMDGATLDVGAVACVKRFAAPIELARLVLASPEVLLVAEGAERFALQRGMQPCDPDWLIVERERTLWQEYTRSRAVSNQGRGDTVGAVALDSQGNIVAGLSTGGTPNKVPGRVGDVPQIGCGFYADNRFGGVACTGWGESVARVALAHSAIHMLQAAESPEDVAEGAIRLLADRVNGEGGLIILDKNGRVAADYNTKRMARAYLTEGMTEPVVAVDRFPWKKGAR